MFTSVFKCVFISGEGWIQCMFEREGESEQMFERERERGENKIRIKRVEEEEVLNGRAKNIKGID